MGLHDPSYYDYYINEIPILIDRIEFIDHSEVEFDDIEKILRENALCGKNKGSNYEGVPCYIVVGRNIRDTLTLEIMYTFVYNELRNEYYCWVFHFMELTYNNRKYLGL